jgi:hypothetical protein
MKYPEGKTFYVRKEGESKVVEIRTKIEISGATKYLIDIKKGVFYYTTQAEFYDIPQGYTMLSVE